MRGLFSIVGLLLVLAIVGVLAKKQLGSVSASGATGAPSAVTSAAQAAGVVLAPANPAPAGKSGADSLATAQQQSRQLQTQIQQSVDAALAQPRPVADDK